MTAGDRLVFRPYDYLPWPHLFGVRWQAQRDTALDIAGDKSI
jgi:hypothetical protein